MLNTPAAQIFISYSHTDSNFVNSLTTDLRAYRLNVWVDKSKLRGGQIWVNEIQHAIDTCQVFLVVLSPDAINAPWVQREYQYALDIQKRVIPILLHPIRQIPLALSNIQPIDFQRSYQSGLRDLLRILDPQMRLDGVEVIGTKRSPTILQRLAMLAMGIITTTALGYIGFLMGGAIYSDIWKWGIATVNGTILGAMIGILLFLAEASARKKQTLTLSLLTVSAFAWAAMIATFYAVVAAHPINASNLFPLAIAAFIGGALGVVIQYARARKKQALSSFMHLVTVIFDGFLGAIGGIFIIDMLTNFTNAFLPFALLGAIAGLVAGGIIEYSQQA